MTLIMTLRGAPASAPRPAPGAPRPRRAGLRADDFADFLHRGCWTAMCGQLPQSWPQFGGHSSRPPRRGRRAADGECNGQPLQNSRGYMYVGICASAAGQLGAGYVGICQPPRGGSYCTPTKLDSPRCFSTFCEIRARRNADPSSASETVSPAPAYCRANLSVSRSLGPGHNAQPQVGLILGGNL